MINDHVSDMLTRLKNAYSVGKRELVVPHTTLCAAVCDVLVSEKYVESVSAVGEGKDKSLKLVLRYVNGSPALTSVRRISKPGVRIYQKVSSMKPVLSGLGTSILSTSKGVMSGVAAKRAKIGGEVLAELW